MMYPAGGNGGMVFSPSLKYLGMLRCPDCHQEEIVLDDQTLRCDSCGSRFYNWEDIPVLLPKSWPEAVGDKAKKLHDESGRHYSDYALIYESDFEDAGVDDIIRLGFFASGGTILDVGCGTGTFSSYVLERTDDVDVFGMDIALGSLAQAKALRIPLLVASNFDVPIKSDIADTVVSWGVIHHTPDPPRCIAELSRVVKPQGHVLLHVARKGSPFYYLVKLLRPFPRMMRKLFKKYGDVLVFPYFWVTFYPMLWASRILFQRIWALPNIGISWKMFNDQFANPVFSFHTHGEMESEFKKHGLSLVKSWTFNRPGGAALGMIFRKD
jgi:SAM-dependent methyltransferase